jgi:hypothetical protein
MLQKLNVVSALAIVSLQAQPLQPHWSGYAHDAQHTGISEVPAQTLDTIHWSVPVDLKPQFSSGELLIHYGSPAISAANTVLVPVKTGTTDGFEIQALSGSDGHLLYTLASDYSLPPHSWTPPYGPILATHSEGSFPSTGDPRRRPLSVRRGQRTVERLYYPGAGGTVYYRDDVDSPLGPNSSAGATGQIAFYGNALYSGNPAEFNSSVRISTPLVSDAAGNIYFGFIVSSPNPAGLVSGIARVSARGAGVWASASAFSGGDSSIIQIALNCAPALSNDQTLVYFAITNDNDSGTGYLVSAKTTDLKPVAHMRLLDPRGAPANVSGSSTAAPTVGPDGDVYYGVLEGPCCGSHNFRGWMLHFDSTLTQTKLPGSFGWDDTASVVPAASVPSYSGSSAYLILTKYNNYAGAGTGDGVNKLALLDPNTRMTDLFSSTPVQVMQEVLTIKGVTAEPQLGFPLAVKEWCINAAAVDPYSKSAVVNSEDGVVYRWDFTTNTFIQSLRLTAGLGEAYTPTLIGPDGTAYAINDSVLFAVGKHCGATGNPCGVVGSQ